MVPMDELMLGAAPGQGHSTAGDVPPSSARRCSPPHARGSGRWFCAISIVALALLLPALAGATAGSQTHAGVPRNPSARVRVGASDRTELEALPRLWAVQVSPGGRGWFDRALLKRVRKDGINTVVLRVSALGRKRAAKRMFDSVRRFAIGEKLYLIAVVPAGKPRTPAARDAIAACSNHRFPRLRCAVRAKSGTAAAKLAREHGSDGRPVAVYVKGPRRVSDLAEVRGSVRRPIIVIAPLDRSFDAPAWAAAVGQTAANATLDLGVAPKGSAALQQFAAMLARATGSAAGAPGSGTTPSTPTGLTPSSVTRSSITLSWNASTGNVAGYRLSLNGAQVGTSTSAGYSFNGLTCGTSYTLGVAAYDAAGNASATAVLGVSTSACSGSGGEVYLSPSGSDGSCLRGQSSHPCATPAGAWAIAHSGDTISVADGTYTSGCVLNGDKTAMTTFVGDGQGVQFVCDVTINGADAGFENLGMYQFDDEANYVSFSNVNLTCQNSAPYALYKPGNKCSTAWNVSGSNFTWVGGSWGPLYESDSPCNGNAPQGATLGWNGNPQNVVISGVYAHDVSIGCSGQHSELMRIDGGNNLTLDGVFMHGCGNSACVFMSNESGQNPTNVTFRNTICDGTGLGGDCFDLDFDGSQGTSILMENDTFLGGIAQNNGNSYAKNQWVIANTIWLGANGCMPGPTYYNDAPFQPDYGGSTDNCGGNQIAVGNHSDNAGTPSTWLACGASCATGGVGLNYSVKSGSPLLHAGSASYIPAVDYAGNSRPCAGQTKPNVGAFERACS